MRNHVKLNQIGMELLAVLREEVEEDHRIKLGSARLRRSEDVNKEKKRHSRCC